MSATAIERVIKAQGGEEALELKLRRFEEDVRYLQSIRQQLVHDYPDRWVAIYENSFVGYARTTQELRKRLMAKGIPANEAVFDLLARERKAMLL